MNSMHIHGSMCVTTGMLAFTGGRCYMRLAAGYFPLNVYSLSAPIFVSNAAKAAPIPQWSIWISVPFHWITFLWKMSSNRKLFFLTGILTLLPHLFSVALNISMFWLRLMKTPLRCAFLFVFLISYAIEHVSLLSHTIHPYCIHTGTFF